MKLGIYLNSQQPESDDPARRFAEMVEQVRLARSLGFDFDLGRRASRHAGLPLLSRSSACCSASPPTPRACGWAPTSPCCPLHNPIEVAEVGAFLDVITGGKFLLGVGLGYRPEEYEMYRVPMSERVSRFNEGVEIIAKLWGGDKVTHQGRHWQFTNATIRPRPLQ